MTRRFLMVAALAALSLNLSPRATAQTERPWIHIEVTEAGDNAKQVRINLPLSAVDVALEMAPDKTFEKGRLKLDGVDLAELRVLWAELKLAGDAEFVSVQSKDGAVRVAREGDKLLVRVNETKDKPKNVKIEAPLSLVDALLSGEGENLNIRAAIAQLRAERGEIVRVENGANLVRVWIDARS